jgi:hypothetical protein
VSSCSEPLDLAILVDYWFGDLDGPDLDRVEEHLLECDACGSVLRSLVATGDGVRRLAVQGAFGVVVSPSFLETASRQGLACASTAFRLEVGSSARSPRTTTSSSATCKGTSAASRVLDLVVQFEDGPEHRSWTCSLRVLGGSDRGAGDAALRALPSSTMRMRLLAREGEATGSSASTRSPTLPGPGEGFGRLDVIPTSSFSVIAALE